jgi:hypothetical protein
MKFTGAVTRRAWYGMPGTESAHSAGASGCPVRAAPGPEPASEADGRAAQVPAMSPAAAAASADGTVFTWDASPAAALSQAFTVPAPRCYTLSHLPTLSALRHLWVPKTCATWAYARGNRPVAGKRSSSAAGPVLVRLEVG